MVPREMSLVKLETEGGNVEPRDYGPCWKPSGGGSIKLDDIGGGVNAETGGGSIDVGLVSGDLGLHTGGGGIVVRQAMERSSPKRAAEAWNRVRGSGSEHRDGRRQH